MIGFPEEVRIRSNYERKTFILRDEVEEMRLIDAAELEKAQRKCLFVEADLEEGAY